MQPKYPLQEWIEKLILEIKEKKEKNDWFLVVLIAWWSSSGKTSQVAKKVANFYENEAILLSMDNYYRWREYVEKNNLNFDQPEALDLDQFYHDLERIKSWETIMIPKYDFVNSRQIPNSIEIKPKKVIIVEWLFALTDEIAKLWDIKTFIDLSEHWRIFRRIFRDVERTKEKPSQILDYFLEIVEPMNDTYIEPTKENADFIILNEFDPIKETSHIKSKDYQVKFNLATRDTEHIWDLILNFWAQYLGDFEFTDYYFTPNYLEERDLENEEVILRRNLDFWKTLFIYKSPLSENEEIEERFVLNFLIDGTTLDGMRKIYWNDIFIIRRKRITYFYHWILIFIDIFENWEQVLEFKFADSCIDVKKVIKNIISNID